MLSAGQLQELGVFPQSLIELANRTFANFQEELAFPLIADERREIASMLGMLVALLQKYVCSQTLNGLPKGRTLENR